jgi:uncharacterized protein (TIGR03086 family)
MFDLEPPAHQMKELVRGVRDDQLSAPTPCAGTSVGDMLDHVSSFAIAFRDAAAKTPGSAPPDPSADHLPPDWRTRIPAQLDELAAAWRDPAAWDGMTSAGGVTMPAEAIGTVAVDELVLHGWDLAKGTGQPFTCDPASTQAVFDFTAHLAEPGMEPAREGLYGPVVDVPSDAPLFDRALGFSGRDPGWRP